MKIIKSLLSFTRILYNILFFRAIVLTIIFNSIDYLFHRFKWTVLIWTI